jgi:hypothetical protein
MRGIATAAPSKNYTVTNARSDVLTLDIIGAFYDTDRSDVSLGWGAYANPPGSRDETA